MLLSVWYLDLLFRRDFAAFAWRRFVVCCHPGTLYGTSMLCVVPSDTPYHSSSACTHVLKYTTPSFSTRRVTQRLSLPSPCSMHIKPSNTTKNTNKMHRQESYKNTWQQESRGQQWSERGECAREDMCPWVFCFFLIGSLCHHCQNEHCTRKTINSCSDSLDFEGIAKMCIASHGVLRCSASFQLSLTSRCNLTCSAN